MIISDNLAKVLPTDTPSTRRRFFFTVERLATADLIVHTRHVLKDTGLVLNDELSPDERTSHNLLWSTFVAARGLGFTAQFNRARLVVSKTLADGTKTKIQVSRPLSPAQLTSLLN